jgi:hypothetical protein
MCFATYIAVHVRATPALAAPLATYLAIITRMAREAPDLAWQRYDRMFRQAISADPSLPWDRRESDIWLAAISETRKGPSQASTSGTSERPRAQLPAHPNTREICRRFCRGECPQGTYCRYRHVCAVCQSGMHPAKDCPLVRPPAKRPPPSGGF